MSLNNFARPSRGAIEMDIAMVSAAFRQQLPIAEQNPAEMSCERRKRHSQGFVKDSFCGIHFANKGTLWQKPQKNAEQVTERTINKMEENGSTGMTRRGLLRAFAATTLVAAPTYTKAAGFLRGAGDVRSIRMYSGRTGESINTIYWIEGEYIKDALAEVNFFMRDWRTNDVKNMDARAIDVMAAAHNLLDASEPFTLLSGYRSPKTNAMLRSRSRGVAKNSLHMKGQAGDLRLSSRSVGQIARAAAACRGGGVGRYSRSNFVHMDCGPVRSWGR